MLATLPSFIFGIGIFKMFLGLSTNFSIKNDKKLLGICYGAEILALTLGGTIRKTKSIQKGNETIEILQNNLITNNSINVFESHSFEISKLPNVLIPIGKSDNCNYEIIQYEKKLIFGTQFHPEMTSDGNDLIEKFCSLLLILITLKNSLFYGTRRSSITFTSS